jgi:tetratricopeptide (TPR) repeat protein
MKTAHVIRDALNALKDGDQLFRQGNYKGSVDCYNKAMKLLASLPASTEFDRRSFEASGYAGLSAAYGRLGKHMESFAAANKALLFYDENGEKYPEHTGRWLKAIVNQGVALAHLGVFAEALITFQRAKEMFLNKSLDSPENKQWVAIVDENIATLTAQLEKVQR